MRTKVYPRTMPVPFTPTDVWHLYGTDGTRLGSGQPGESSATVEHGGVTASWSLNDMPFWILGTREQHTVSPGDTVTAPTEIHLS